MRCPKCKRARMRKIVSVIVECDEDCFRLSKAGIRSADVQVMGVDWESKSPHFCPRCGHAERLTKE